MELKYGETLARGKYLEFRIYRCLAQAHCFEQTATIPGISYYEILEIVAVYDDISKVEDNQELLTQKQMFLSCKHIPLAVIELFIRTQNKTKVKSTSQ